MKRLVSLLLALSLVLALTACGQKDTAPDTTQSRSGSSQEYMSQFYVGMRGAWNSGTADNLAGGEELWQALTAGAVSTLREG